MCNLNILFQTTYVKSTYIGQILIIIGRYIHSFKSKYIYVYFKKRLNTFHAECICFLNLVTHHVERESRFYNNKQDISTLPHLFFYTAH